MRCRLLFLAVTAIAFQSAAAKQPHILLVVADDYGWHDIGYHGSEIKTPHLDRFAAEGVKLENYYVQPICTPTRSQLMSGRYQIHTGLQHGVIKPNVPNGLPLEDKTLASKLKELGYSTHMVGKWHLGFYKKEYTPTYRGFDSFFGYYCGAEAYFTHFRCEGGCGVDLHDNMENADEYKGKYSAHVFAEKAEKVIYEHGQNKKEKPMFLYLPFQSVHAPLEVPSEYEKPYEFIKDQKRKTYAGMVAAMDEAVGKVAAALEENGMWEDTIMIFSTDNGGQIHAGGNNWPLRGWKASLWEGGLHGVGFVRGNMLKNKGIMNKQLVHVSDWYPTLVSLAGGNTTGQQLDGHDVWKAISENEESPRSELLHNIDPLFNTKGEEMKGSPFDVRVRAALRVGDYKLITGDPGNGSWIEPPTLSDSTLRFKPVDATLRFIKSDNYKPEPAKNLWLFNIKEDPNEKDDLSDRMPDKVREMLAKLAQYNATAVPCRFPKPDPKSNPQLHGGFWVPWE